MSSLKDKLKKHAESNSTLKNKNKLKNKYGLTAVLSSFTSTLTSISKKIKNSLIPKKYSQSSPKQVRISNTTEEASLLPEGSQNSNPSISNKNMDRPSENESISDMISVNLDINKFSDNADNLKKEYSRQYEDTKANSTLNEKFTVNQASSNQKQAITILSLLLDIEQASRRANKLDELRFIIVNRTYEMTQYDRCVLIEETPFGLRVGAISNIPILNREAPFIIWLQQYIKELEKKRLLLKTLRLSAEDQESILCNKWLQLAPPYMLITPLSMNGLERPALLIMFNNQPWVENDFVLLQHLCEAYAYCINPLLHRKFIPTFQKRKRLIQTTLLIALIIICFIPVRQKALAPAEIAPFNPAYLSAPIEGVIKDVLVEPNTIVQKSQLVMKLEDTDLSNAYIIANSSFRIAEANLLRVTQESFNNPSTKADVALAQSQLEKASVELNFASDQLARINIYSPASGIIIFRDKSDFIGQPIKVGQRLFLIADPNLVELSIDLPVSNAIPLEDNASLRFFVNSDPLNPINGTLFYHSVRAEANSSQIAVYKLRAKLNDSETVPRLGSKGTAHIYGSKTLFILYVLRKPIGVARQFLGL